MIYSTACEYAIRALAELAHQPERFVPLKALAQRGGIPVHFLGKILQDLVRAGVLASAKGPRGGFRLARRPEELTLFEVKRVIDGPVELKRCALGLPQCSDEQPCSHHELWSSIRKQVEDFMKLTTVAELGRAAPGAAAPRSPRGPGQEVR